MMFSMNHMLVNAMIVTMNEQHKNFICEIRKCGLLHETDPSLPFPLLGAISMMIVSLPFR